MVTTHYYRYIIKTGATEHLPFTIYHGAEADGAGLSRADALALVNSWNAHQTIIPPMFIYYI